LLLFLLLFLLVLFCRVVGPGQCGQTGLRTMPYAVEDQSQ